MHSISLKTAYRHAASHGKILPKLLQSTQASKLEPSPESDAYWNEPQYPPIQDISIEARRVKRKEEIHKKIEKIQTVEEKQIALNMPKYYGFKCVRFYEDKVHYGALPMVQHYTRTHLVEKKGLPDCYKASEGAAAALAKDIKEQIEEALSMEHNVIKRNPEYSLEKPVQQQAEDANTRMVIRQLNRIITNALAESHSHILSAQVDYDPRHEAFWFVGGVDPPLSVKRFRREKYWLKKTLDEPIDRVVSYSGTPLVALRSHLPLRPLVDYSKCKDPSLNVPKYTYHPQTAGYDSTYMHGTNIPGYWTGDKDEFGFLSFHGRGHMLERKEWFGEKDNLEALDCQAMKASFGWLLAQASYQGFTSYNDLTYPLVTQTVITNGQIWSLYAYQLNTIKFHNQYINVNPKRNICYGTGPLKLFEGFENGKVNGLNEEVLQKIIQLYMNAPEERNYDMKPFLGEEEQCIADIEHDEKRKWLEEIYKHMMSNRPRHRLAPEMYLWEKIYKVMFKTRSQEARRRYFELDERPFNRRLDEHSSHYIPKVIRPYPKAKKKFVTTYYPKV